MQVRIISLLLAVLASVPQVPQLPPIGETIEVSIVNVDVFVTDKSGNRVRGLTKDDFEVFEDGKLQPITNFAEYADAVPVSAPATSSIDASPRRQKRTLVIFIDQLTLRPNKSKEVFDQLRETVRTLVEPGDAVSIVKWRREHRMWVVVPFTDDVVKLDAALARLSGERLMEGTSVVEQAREESAWIQEQAGIQIDPRRRSTLSDAYTVGTEFAATVEYEDIRAKTRSLKMLMSAMAADEGQKSLVMLTRKFSMNAGYETGVMSRFNQDVGDPWWGTGHMVDEVSRSANANGVRIYGIYPQEMTSVLMIMNQIGALDVVTHATGGEMTWHPTETIKLLKRIPDDFRNYYSLAYRATSTSTDRSHKIRVKVKTPGLIVRSRKEYLEKSQETRMAERVVSRLYGLSAGEPTVPIAVKLGKARPTKKNRYTLPVSVKVPIGALTALSDGKQSRGEFSVYVAGVNATGEISDVTHRTQPFAIPAAELEKAQHGHFTYDLDVLIDSASHELTVAVLDDVSKEFGVATVAVAR